MFVVAGATGQVGGVTARTLLARGADVRVILRDDTQASPWLQRGAEVAVGNLGDAEFLATWLTGAEGFFTLLPLDLSSSDVHGDQKRLSDSIGSGVADSGIPHVVLLSSHGAEHPDGTGPVACMHYLEDLLHRTAPRVTMLRSGYRQENLGPILPLARAQGILPSWIPAEVPVRMVAARDVGTVAADSLLASPGQADVVDIQGPWYSMTEVAGKLGAALGRQLAVLEIPPADRVQAFRQAGMSPQVAESFTEMYAALAAGRFTPAGDRLIEGTTPIDVVIQDLMLA